MPLMPTLPEQEAAPEEERASILIVDDLPEKLLVFGTVLEELGQDLVFVRSGTEALREVLHHEFAVILLDVNMPDIDGFETAGLIRRYKKSRHTPIIFITAYADEMQTHRGYSLGAVDYILSPVVPEVLRSKVKVFVELHIMQRRLRQQADQRVALAASEAARRAAEENTKRSNFLSRVSHELSGSLVTDIGMRKLLEMLVPEMAPFAALVVPEDDDVPRRALVCRAIHSPTGPTELADLKFTSLPASVQQAFGDVLSGRCRVAPHLAPKAMADQTVFDSDMQGWPDAKVFSLMVGGRVLGALLVAPHSEARSESMFEELAERAAIAFENARLYRRLQDEIVERRQAQARLQEASQRKDEFLAMLSHELRNPLAPIRNAVEVIRLIAASNPKLAWAADVTDRQVTHLTRLVEELLDVARISQGKIALQFAAVDLHTLIGHSAETARPFVDSRGHHLVMNLPAAPTWVRGDVVRLSQVLGNLLNNAAKYTPEGGSIELTLCVRDGQALISVRDNGIGIEAELLPSVFDLFAQGKRSIDRSQGGLGVGLTLVRHLVELHQGHIEARSDGPGRGAEFVVFLPCVSEVQKPDAADAPLAPAISQSDCRVLVVDDNFDAAETIAMFLRLQGLEASTACDGQEALDRAAEFLPQVVVLDIGLPRLDGYEVARRLRQQPQMREALLIALTGYGQRDDREKASSAGFDQHMVKPADPYALVETIAQWRGRGPSATNLPMNSVA